CHVQLVTRSLFLLLFSRSILTLPHVLFYFVLPRPPTSPLFPYTTLFRSGVGLLHHPAGDSVADGAFPRRHPRNDRDGPLRLRREDRKSTRLNSSHQIISYAVFCLKKKKISRIWRNSTQISCKVRTGLRS